MALGRQQAWGEMRPPRDVPPTVMHGPHKRTGRCRFQSQQGGPGQGRGRTAPEAPQVPLPFPGGHEAQGGVWLPKGTRQAHETAPQCQVTRPPSAGWGGLGGLGGLGWLGVWGGLGGWGVAGYELRLWSQSVTALILALPHIGSERWTSYLSFPVCEMGMTAPTSQEGASQHRCMERA